MNTPDSIFIKGDFWLVEAVEGLRDDDGNECDGITDYDNFTICLNKAIIGTELEEETLMHEIIHATLHSMNIELDRVLDECLASTISKVMHSLFKIETR